jgi:CRP/FNR family transcriptional regulator, polysaccharide utilization system transcription regulator
MKKILIIEDNKDVRENIVEILSLAGYEVTSAENGKLGISSVFTFKPDLILCDVMMPELDGYGVMKILQSNAQFSHIPLIFLTAKSEKTDMRKGMALGAVDYIIKPFDDTDLLTSIELRLQKAESSINLNSNQFLTLENLPKDYVLGKLTEMSANADVLHMRKKDTLFAEGHLPRYIYLILSGKVRIVRTNDMGKELTIRIVKENEFCGFLDPINNKDYSKSGYILEDCTYKQISVKDFLQLIVTDHHFGLSMLKYMSLYINVLENAVLDQAYSSVRRKVANALVFCYQANNGNVDIHILREELASIAGSAKETVIRTLSDFKQEKLIDINEQGIIIQNLNALVSMHQ